MRKYSHGLFFHIFSKLTQIIICLVYQLYLDLVWLAHNWPNTCNFFKSLKSIDTQPSLQLDSCCYIRHFRSAYYHSASAYYYFDSFPLSANFRSTYYILSHYILLHPETFHHHSLQRSLGHLTSIFICTP